MSNKMWGGRFSEGPDAIMEEINASIDFDKKLYSQDIAGSKAHVRMLAAQGIIEADDAQAIEQGLNTIAGEIEAGDFTFSRALEDIHMNVESRLADLIGPAAGRLHTARSRNDQVATDFRLWVRDTMDTLDSQLGELQMTFAAKALEFASAVMPGFTHLQSAQPVTFGHHMLAYVEMLSRDRGRVQDARKRMNESPLGSAALAGTSFPIDRHMTAKTLASTGQQPTPLTALPIATLPWKPSLRPPSAQSIFPFRRRAGHLVIRPVPLREAFGQILHRLLHHAAKAQSGRSRAGPRQSRPHHRNHERPDDRNERPAAHLFQGHAGGQGAGFRRLAKSVLCIAAMTGMVGDLEPDVKELRKAAGSGYSTATDLADWLVRSLNMPFRNAHHVTGTLVAMASERNIELHKLSLEDMQSVEPAITEDIFSVLSVEKSVRSRLSYGGTAPANVKKQAKSWLKKLEKEQAAKQ